MSSRDKKRLPGVVELREKVLLGKFSPYIRDVYLLCLFRTTNILF